MCLESVSSHSMTEVAAQRSLTSNAVHFGDGTSKFGTKVKRKTISELRGEQLKRKRIVELVDESPPSSLHSKANGGSISEANKPDLPKVPRFVNTRMNEVYPARKSSIPLSAKQTNKINIGLETPTRKLSSCRSSVLAENNQSQLSKRRGDSLAFTSTMDGTVPAFNAEKFGENRFCSVADLSSGGENLSSKGAIDTDKAFKGLVAPDPWDTMSNFASYDKRHAITSANSISEFHVPGKKTPLDFTLKTTMRVLTSSPVTWFHRLVSSCPWYNLPDFDSEFGCDKRKVSTELNSSCAVNPRALHSWVYPDSSLPPSIISMLNSSAIQGEQMDFLRTRKLAWEISFRSLYYMLRKNICNIFYVCTIQFVVMFTGDGSMKGTRTCSAYISRSTQGLRSLLKEHDICFSMPLCRSKVVEVAAEDLVELSEMEKHNVGQIRRLNSTSGVDNSEQSLLAFIGNNNVHALYDFLLNYRHLLKSLASDDLPVLYSPVPFHNATLSAPEVRCKEVRRADNVLLPLKPSMTNHEQNQASPASLFYSIEIKNTCLPPWVISTFCEVISAKSTSFEASFVTMPNSSGLNVVLDTILKKSDDQKTANIDQEEGSHVYSASNATVSPHLHSSSLKCLKYKDDSYTAIVSPL
ncbi:protein downstream neighbor of Son-like isoform X2 [Impatiens glandulifera]|uniref:protein downstream neighbor of Son-like isoform X2 n=1 Tax=Impatiens glandulifera TaxID=253017 RepID=UPI001FB0E06C|nr:protein downstream neighbor of Son-like isoform X2 [Impatiens glandulifera]